MLAEAVGAVLAADEALAGMLPGGVWVHGEISRMERAGAFDANGELLSCGLVKLESEGAAGVHRAAGRGYVAIYLYQGFGAADLAMAAGRIFTLLDGVDLAAGVWDCRWSGDTAGLYDPGLRCRMYICRYAIVRNKITTQGD